MSVQPANPTVVAAAPNEVIVVDQAVPEPGPREVLVQTRCSLISTGTELTLVGGGARPGSVWAGLSQYPRQLGYSNIGEVIRVGSGVDPRWIGKRVHSHAPHQAIALAPANKLAEVPPQVTDEAASFTTLAKVAMNAIRRGGMTWGERVAVIGLGVVGQLAARLSEVAGARRVFAAEPSTLRRSLLPSGGPYCLLDPSPEASWSDEVLDEHGNLLDVVIEASGNPDVMTSAAELLRPMGRLVIASSPSGASTFDFHDACNRRSLIIIGAHSSHHPLEVHPSSPWTSSRHGELFLDLLATGRIEVESLVTHRISLRQGTQAYRALLADRREALGIVLTWHESS